MKLHHIGIVTTHIQIPISVFQLKPEELREIVIDHEQQNEIHLYNSERLGIWHEIIIPLNAQSTVWNSSKKGNSVHHLAYQTEDFDATIESMLVTPGVIKLGGYHLRVDAFGGEIETQFIFANGFLTELIRKK
jgi:hypothetical protein